MTAWIISGVISVGVAVLIGWALPSWAMSRLLPALEGSGHLVTNYRGRRIPTGLGLVWLVWAAGVAGVAALANGVLWTVVQASSSDATAAITAAAGVFGYAPVALVAGAFAFGFVDDVYGSGDAKGFRGHLRAMAAGGLTTGGLKLIGIGLFAAYAALSTDAFGHELGRYVVDGSVESLLLAAAGWVCAALVIALAANLVNLTDLRPGRALKTYALLAISGVLITFLWSALADPLGPDWLGGLLDVKIASVCTSILLLGPVAAVWRYDLGERAMMGDAGANAMGALAGFYLAKGAPLWLLVVLLVVLLALNLASERFSFSRVIERVPALRWIDGLGRLPVGSESVDAGQDGDDGTRTGGSAAEGDDARRDGVS